MAMLAVVIVVHRCKVRLALSKASFPRSHQFMKFIVSKLTGTPPCGREALALLNCVAEKNYDESRCAALMKALRSCVDGKHVKNFALDVDDEKQEKAPEGQATGQKN